MEQTVNQKYQGPQWIDDHGNVRPLYEFTTSNTGIAHEMIGHSIEDAGGFAQSFAATMEISRRGSRPFKTGDVVCGSYDATKVVAYCEAHDSQGVGYTLALVPSIIEIIEQGRAKTASEVEHPYMWAKVVVRIHGTEPDPVLAGLKQREVVA